MNVLAIDTSLNACSIALMADGIMLFEEIVEARNNQSEVLPNLIDKMIKKTSIKPNTINRVVVTIGPGSFNGVRIGLGFAKSFALALGIPCIGVSTLDVLLQSSKSESKVAIIETNGTIYLKAVDKAIIREPKRLEFEDFENLDFSPYSEILGIMSSDSKHSARIKNVKVVSPSILAKMSVLLNENDNPPIPLYLRGADAKPWAGSRYV